MANYVKNANIFGRIGSGIGQGLAEQVPKEIERHRLASGLKQFEQDADSLTPLQQVARLSAIPGITPQTIQSASELAKHQGVRNSFINNARGGKSNPQSVPKEVAALREQQREFGGGRLGNRQSIDAPNDNIENGPVKNDISPTREAEAKSQPGVVKENPTQQKFVPAVRWTPEEKASDIAREFERNPHFTYEQARQRSDDNEQRYINAPEDYQRQQKYLKDQEDEADKEFNEQLKTALQKEGAEVYGDISGNLQLDLKKVMRNDLATNPSLTPRTAAEKWRKIGEDFVHKRNILKEKANTNLANKISPYTKEETLKDIKSAQKAYANLGKEREFYNILRSINKPAVYEINKQNGLKEIQEPGSFGFSFNPGPAALAAFPRSEPVKSLINNQKFKAPDSSNIGSGNYQRGVDYNDKMTRKFAEDVSKTMSRKDSILAIATSMKNKYPYFNERTFYDYFREHQDELRLTPEQEDDLVQGIPGYNFNWADYAVFPFFGRSVVDD